MEPPPPTAVRGNRWIDLAVPPLGGWAPHRTVTVVIPCYQGAEKLAITVAALDRQTYPGELLSVVVVDDGSDPPLRPPATHRVRVEMARQERSGFGIARARNLGAELASGDIVIFLDSDMIPEPQWAEAHARWHHLVGDALTLGFRRHVEVSGLTAADVGIAAESGLLAPLFAGRHQQRPEWIEFHMERTSELTRPETDLFRVVTGGNLGMRRDTIIELGGFDTGFDRWGAEDTELGYRAFTWGALLVPERAAAAWHQGLGTLPDPGEARALEEQRSLLAHLIAEPSFRPRVAGRSYRVPMVVVRVDGSGAAAGDVAGSVESAVGSRLHDLVVSLIVPDTHPDAVWLRRRFEGDPRVLISDRPDDMERVPFAPVRVMLPAGARLARGALDRLLDRLRGRGAVEVPRGQRHPGGRHHRSIAERGAPRVATSVADCGGPDAGAGATRRSVGSATEERRSARVAGHLPGGEGPPPRQPDPLPPRRRRRRALGMDRGPAPGRRLEGCPALEREAARDHAAGAAGGRGRGAAVPPGCGLGVRWPGGGPGP